MLGNVPHLLPCSQLLVCPFWVPTHLMPVDPVSRYVGDWDGDLEKLEERVGKRFMDLRAMDHYIEPYTF